LEVFGRSILAAGWAVNDGEDGKDGKDGKEEGKGAPLSNIPTLPSFPFFPSLIATPKPGKLKGLAPTQEQQ
jgi:hypothetical protein